MQDVVNVINALGAAWALAAMVVGLAIVLAIRASVAADAQRATQERRDRHAESMERLRVENAKEITPGLPVRRLDNGGG